MQAEIAATSSSSSNGPARTNQRLEDDSDEDDNDNDEEEQEEFEDISGTSCSILYRHEWGAHQRHNAVVLSVEPSSPDDDEVCLHFILFIQFHKTQPIISHKNNICHNTPKL